MAEVTNQPKYTVPEGLELSAEQRDYYEKFGRIPKPVRAANIKTNKVCTILNLQLFYFDFSPFSSYI